MSNAANVKVIARFRPMNELEKTSGNEQVCVFTSPTSLQFNSTREKNVYRYNLTEYLLHHQPKKTYIHSGSKK